MKVFNSTCPKRACIWCVSKPVPTQWDPFLRRFKFIWRATWGCRANSLMVFPNIGAAFGSIRYSITRRLGPKPSRGSRRALVRLNVFADEILQNQAGQNLGPFIRSDRATITMRRAKAPITPLDPFLQLIAPSGTLFAENESGFGDDLSQDLSDAALANVALAPEFGFFRFLTKGYDKQPDGQSFGSFFVRLETAGNYDQSKIVVSNNDEIGTTAQKSGTISTARQRDSYRFHAAPGQLVNIVVNGKSLGAGLPA